MSAPMIASCLVVGSDPRTAAADAARGVAAALGERPDLAVVFASPALSREPEIIRDAIASTLAPRHLIGCTGEAIIGIGQEIEDQPAAVVWAAVLPGARITPIRALGWRDVDGSVEAAGWPTSAGDPATDTNLPGPDDVVIALADPWSFPIDILLGLTNASTWQPQVIGGLASGGTRQGEHVLWLDDQDYREGLVGVSIGGANLITVVSQGCTPIGPEMVVTDADGFGHIAALAGKPALTKLQDILNDLDDDALELANSGVTVGIVMNENQPDYARGDFLMRGLLGANPDTGEIHIGEHVRVGQTLRLHVRDQASADQDLRAAAREASTQLGGPVAGALVFSCNGRGTHMFDQPHHDARVVAEELGDPPIAGLFCNGEIGPVGGRNFLHGFTATIAVFAATHHVSPL
jgi:small ligand-binding sensory domain FIST